MRFLVLGAGAVGGYFGGRLAEAKIDTTFLVRPARAQLLRERGLAVDSPIGDFRVPVQLATSDTLEGHFDVVLLTAKAYDLDDAIAAITPAVGPESAILPLLNGLGHLDRLDAAFGAGRVLGGVAYIGAVLRSDGVIRHHNRLNGITYGERAGGQSARTKAIQDAFAGTKATATASDNILLDMWEKFVMITAMAGMNCLMRGTIGEIVATGEGKALMLALIDECEAVAQAAGFAPRPKRRELTRAMLTEADSVNSASMRQDLEAGRRTEAEAILGDMVRRARGFALDTPLLRAARCCLEVHENRLARRR